MKRQMMECCCDQQVGLGHSGARAYCASPIFDGKDEKIIFENRINNPIVTFPNPIQLVETLDLCDAGWTRTGAKRAEPFQ